MSKRPSTRSWPGLPERRELLTEVEALRAERNVVSKEIGRTKDKEARQAKIAEMRAVGDRIKNLEAGLKTVESDLYGAMLQVPNLPGPGVPVGPDDEHNVIVWEKGELRDFDFEPDPPLGFGTHAGYRRL